MPLVPVVTGLPGIRAAQSTSPKIIFKGADVPTYLPAGKLIDGSKSRDPSNTGNVDTLQVGLLMGKITASGLYAPSIMGTLTVAFSSGTSMTVGAATAVELARRVGTSGTFKLIGPAAAAGPVNVATVTYSAVNTSTGVITVTDPGLAFVSGSFVCPTDGSENILTFIPDMDQTGIKVTDADGTTNLTVQFPLVPVGNATVISANLINWPSDASLQARVVGQLNAAAGGKWSFDHIF